MLARQVRVRGEIERPAERRYQCQSCGMRIVQKAPQAEFQAFDDDAIARAPRAQNAEPERGRRQTQVELHRGKLSQGFRPPAARGRTGQKS